MAVRALEFYAGIGVLVRNKHTKKFDHWFQLGGLHVALRRSSADGVVVRAFDWDPVACQVYRINHLPNIIQKVSRSLDFSVAYTHLPWYPCIALLSGRHL